MFASARSCIVSALALAAAWATVPTVQAADTVAPTREQVVERFLAMLPDSGVSRWQVPIRARTAAPAGAADGPLGRKLALLAEVTRREMGLAGQQTANLIVARGVDLPSLRTRLNAEEQRLLPKNWSGKECTLELRRDGPRGITGAFLGIPEGARETVANGCVAYGLFVGLGFIKGRIPEAYSVAGSSYIDLTPQDLVMLKLLYSGHVTTGMTAAVAKARAWDGLVAEARLDRHWQILPAAFEETLLVNAVPRAARSGPPVPTWTRPMQVGVEGMHAASGGIATHLSEWRLVTQDDRGMTLIDPHLQLLKGVTGLDIGTARVGINVLVHVNPDRDKAGQNRLYERMRALFAKRQEFETMLAEIRAKVCEGKFSLNNGGLILVNGARPTLEVRSCIKHELNAALYPTGAFVRSDWSSFPVDSIWAELTPLDLALLRLAYHPRMQQAKTPDEARAVAAALIPEMSRDTTRAW